MKSAVSKSLTGSAFRRRESHSVKGEPGRAGSELLRQRRYEGVERVPRVASLEWSSIVHSRARGRSSPLSSRRALLRAAAIMQEAWPFIVGSGCGGTTARRPARPSPIQVLPCAKQTSPVRPCDRIEKHYEAVGQSKVLHRVLTRSGTRVENRSGSRGGGM